MEDTTRIETTDSLLSMRIKNNLEELTSDLTCMVDYNNHLEKELKLLYSSGRYVDKEMCISFLGRPIEYWFKLGNKMAIIELLMSKIKLALIGTSLHAKPINETRKQDCYDTLFEIQKVLEEEE